MIVTVPLQTNHMNAFYADGETDAPFFYIKWDGSGYSMIDGAQYDLYETIQPLLIDSIEFTYGNYSYTGTLLGENGETIEITITFIFNNC